MKPNKPDPFSLDECNLVQIHYKRPLFDISRKIDCSEAAELIFRKIADPHRLDHKEFFWVLLLTNANQVIAISEVAVGSSHGACVNFKEIFQLAILTNASGLIIAHNHPSGKLEASTADIKITQKLKESVKILDISLLDHLIITTEGYYSFTDNNLL